MTPVSPAISPAVSESPDAVEVGSFHPTMPAANGGTQSELQPGATQGGHTTRFTFIDGLRGWAAFSVAAYHIERYGPLTEPASAIIPVWLRTIIQHGWIGVQVFFVISGFVIAYSVRNARITPGFLGNFALRRSIRLDPPYWATIAVVLSLDFIARMAGLFPSPLDEAVTWQQLLAHPCYLQNVLGYGNLSVGFWTLCIEMQFYLLFVSLLGLAQRLPWGVREKQSPSMPWNLFLTFAPLALLSLFVFHLDSSNDDWVIHFFCMFFLGALAWWVMDGRVSPRVFWAYVGLMVVRLACNWTFDLFVAIVAGISIHLAARRGKLSTWLNWRWLQYLGRISYSLYLIHYPVSHLIVCAGHALTGDSPGWAVAWELISLAASVAVAHLLYLWVEAPSVRFAARLKTQPALQPREAAAPAAGIA